VTSLYRKRKGRASASSSWDQLRTSVTGFPVGAAVTNAVAETMCLPWLTYLVAGLMLYSQGRVRQALVRWKRHALDLIVPGPEQC
jgi:hypothetical protein